MYHGGGLGHSHSLGLTMTSPSLGVLLQIRLVLQVRPDMSKSQNPRLWAEGAWPLIPSREAIPRWSPGRCIRLFSPICPLPDRPRVPSHPERSNGRPVSGRRHNLVLGDGRGLTRYYSPCRYFSTRKRTRRQMLDKGQEYSCHERYIVSSDVAGVETPAHPAKRGEASD